MRRYWPYLFLSASIFLAGCSTSECAASLNNATGITSSSCQHALRQQELAAKLRSDGIQVVQVGEEVTLVLPTDRFFPFNSNNMKSNPKVLNDIIDFINSYPTVNVQVIGYPNNSGNSVRNLALSRAQAEGIAHYLWGNGLDTRLISANAKQTTCEVPRIEIFFRLPPPLDVFH
ncbi:MAG TPA: OmpA family protein [Gammaproteobacteria bacterium]|nr:OmpA family protein [Gammaproteobacteria bacterium]